MTANRQFYPPYSAEQVAEMTGKTRQAVTRWAQRNPGVGKRVSGVWLFDDADVAKIASLKRGPKRKPRKKAPAAAPVEGGEQ